MKKFFHSRFFYVVLAAALIVSALFLVRAVNNKNAPVLVTTVVESGQVRELVSVSGIAKAQKTAELAFPTTGIVKEVFVKIGDEMKTGDPLIRLDTRALEADRMDAMASLARAEADRSELIQGPTLYAREVTDETVAGKESALQIAIANETQKITNAYQTLLSTDLTAYTDDARDDAIAPTVSGTYTCILEGTYILEMFSSSAKSGYSYRLSGLENGTESVFTNQPSPLGNCGLKIQFDESSNYSRSQWKIDMPNKRSSFYTTNKNAYSLALVQAESTIATAENSLSLTKVEAKNSNSPARNESVSRANAALAQARANLIRIDAALDDRTLLAPFDGVVTDIDILPGETVTPVPVVTILASDEFEVTARIPEIDIGKLVAGQEVNMLFDAKNDDILTGEIRFISPKSTEIDGVAYYEAIVSLDRIPDWIRSGLNADIEIIISEQEGNLRVPKRFIIETKDGYEVLLRKDEITSSSSVEVVLKGNDGFVSVTGLNSGDVLVAP